jgi:multidrug efflux system membrane fusion protein
VITQLDPISVIFTTAEDQLPPILAKMRAGQQLTVEAWDRELKDKLADGTLETIDNQIDPTTGTLKLRAVFGNSNGKLYPSQFVNARLLVEQKQNVTLLANSAIQRNSQGTYVWLVNPDQTVTVRPITVGTTEGDESEIKSGLSPGDTVVTVGVDRLEEGGKVNAQVPGDKPVGGKRDGAPRNGSRDGKQGGGRPHKAAS